MNRTRLHRTDHRYTMSMCLKGEHGARPATLGVTPVHPSSPQGIPNGASRRYAYANTSATTEWRRPMEKLKAWWNSLMAKMRGGGAKR